MSSCKHTTNAERAFQEWLNEQPIGTEWTAADVYAMMKSKGRQYELLSMVSAANIMRKFDNVAVKVGRNKVSHQKMNIYWKVKE